LSYPIVVGMHTHTFTTDTQKHTHSHNKLRGKVVSLATPILQSWSTRLRSDSNDEYITMIVFYDCVCVCVCMCACVWLCL